MGSGHVIDELLVELAFPDEAAAFAAQSHWKTLVEHRLLPVAETLFGTVGRPGELRRYDRIEVDLGVVSPGDATIETERRFRERLLAALGTARAVTRDATPGDVRVLTRTRSDLEQLEYFLVHGRLPWHAAAEQARSPADLVRDVLQSSAVPFADWLRQIPDRARVIRRLVRQFASDILDTVVQALAPRHTMHAADLASILERLFLDSAEGAVHPPVLGELVREALLHALLDGGAAPIDTARFARDAFKRTARLLGRDNTGTAAALRAGLAWLRTGPASTHDALGMQHILRLAVGLDEASIAPGGHGAVDLGSPDIEATPPGVILAWRADQLARLTGLARLRVGLERAIVQGMVGPVAASWAVLVHEHPALVVAVVKHHGRLVRVRRRMAIRLPELMLLDIVRLLEPAHSRFIEEIVHRPDLFPRADAAPGKTAGVRRRQIWEFTLGYLLVERGGHFNKQTYLGSLVRQMAAHDNIGYRDLLAAMTGALAQVTTPSPLQAEMVNLLRALTQELGAAAATDDGTAAISALDAYAATAVPLLGDDPWGGAMALPTAPDIERLAAQFPRQLARLHRELQVRSQSGAAIWARLDEAALRRLTIAVAAHLQGAGARAASDFVAAIERGAAEVGDTRAYFKRILDGLLHQDTVDLEAIVGADRRPESSATSVAAREVTLADAPGDADAIERRIATWLERGEDNVMAAGWDRWRAEHPEALRVALRRLAAQDGQRRAMAIVFSAPVFLDVVQLFEPAAAGVAAAIVQRPDWFGANGGPGAPDGRGRSLREFTLAYLLVERGGSFNKRVYLGDLVRRMAAHENRSAGNVLDAMIAALASDSAPGALQIELLAVLRSLVSEAPAVDSPHLRTRPGPRAAPVPEARSHPGRRRGRMAKAQASSTRRSAPTGSETRPPRSRPAGATADLAALALLLRRPDSPSKREAVQAVAIVERLLKEAPVALRRLLAWVLEDRRAVDRLVELAPERWLMRLLQLLRPGECIAAQRCADIVATACLDRTLGFAPAHLRVLQWRFMFWSLIGEGRPLRIPSFARDLVAIIATRVPATQATRWRARLVERLQEDRIASDSDYVRAIAEALAMDEMPAADGGTAPHLQRVALHRAMDAALPAPGEAIHVANAGVVLATPYLPRLFAMLGLTANEEFVDAPAAERAVHLIQFLVDGSTDTAEPLLVLNKILCGVAIDTPIARDVSLTDHEKQVVEGLVAGMIGNWKAIGSTSVAGMRESFFQREGRLTLKDDAWHLLVEPRAFDMLLDRLPWSYSMIRHPWMDRIVHVDWR